MRRQMRFEAGFETDAHRHLRIRDLWSSVLPDAGHRPAGDERLGIGHQIYRISHLLIGIRRSPKLVPSENGLTIRSGFSRAFCQSFRAESR